MNSRTHRFPTDEVIARFGVPVVLGLAPLLFLRTGGEFENNPKSGFLQCGIALLALYGIVRGSRESSGQRAWDPLGLALIVFGIAALLSLTRAVNPLAARPFLMHWAAGATLLFLLLHTLRGREAVPRLFLAFTLGGAAVSLVGLAQVWPGLSWIPQVAPPASTFGNRNMAAHFVAICFPSMLGLVFLSNGGRSRFVGGAGLVISALYLFYARSLAAWIAVLIVIVVGVVGAILVLGKTWGRARRRMLAAVVLLLPGLATGGLLSARDAKTTSQRLVYWKNTAVMARDHPVLGVGLGNFGVQYPRYSRAAEVDWTFDEEHQVERVHNDHLQILAELGLVGLAAWLWIFIYAGRRAWGLLRVGPAWIRAQTLFVSLGIVSVLTVASFSFPLERAMPPIYLCAFLGMLGSLGPRREAGSGRSVPLGLRWVVAALLVVFLATSFVLVRRAIVTDFHYTQGLRRTNAGEHEQAVSVLQKARALSPHDTRVLLVLARALAGTGRCDLALEPLERVLRLEPYNVNAHSNLGHCHAALGDHAESERYWRETLEILPDSPQVHTNLGTALLRQNEVEAAVASYHRAIDLARMTLFLPSARIESRLLQPQLLLAKLYVEQDRLAEAIARYEEILRERPLAKGVRPLLAELYRTVGEPEKARRLNENQPGSGSPGSGSP